MTVHNNMHKTMQNKKLTCTTSGGGGNVFPLNSNVNLWTLVGLSLGMIEVVEKICLHFFQVLYSGHLG